MVSTFLFRAGSRTLPTYRTKLPATIVEDRKTINNVSESFIQSIAEALKMPLAKEFS